MNTSTPQYDRAIIPGEIAARKNREGEFFGAKPEEVQEEAINTTGGYTIDREGLLNNYAVEPEMYIEVPGDLRTLEEQRAKKRVRELKNLAEDGQGKLTMDKDIRGKGSGLI
ncbi:conserved hypothetical protein [Crocosphaera subtropica ATCC 51142]|uniref:Uncharacterized protein n=1 Tax=Crocosphaera subtropica (strain ATCC 51142 / BH68) TaxID=43989 RepID=B1X215_CROS5|nr:hypothetical protein [Crocosphaera subtropica]ACB54176.1 conserved hypothetical protein [Crocosphaera subtropica ATCC 51142]